MSDDNFEDDDDSHYQKVIALQKEILASAQAAVALTSATLDQQSAPIVLSNFVPGREASFDDGEEPLYPTDFDVETADDIRQTLERVLNLSAHGANVRLLAVSRLLASVLSAAMPKEVLFDEEGDVISDKRLSIGLWLISLGLNDCDLEKAQENLNASQDDLPDDDLPDGEHSRDDLDFPDDEEDEEDDDPFPDDDDEDENSISDDDLDDDNEGEQPASRPTPPSYIPPTAEIIPLHTDEEQSSSMRLPKLDS